MCSGVALGWAWYYIHPMQGGGLTTKWIWVWPGACSKGSANSNTGSYILEGGQCSQEPGEGVSWETWICLAAHTPPLLSVSFGHDSYSFLGVGLGQHLLAGSSGSL